MKKEKEKLKVRDRQTDGQCELYKNYDPKCKHVQKRKNKLGTHGYGWEKDGKFLWTD